MISRAFTTNNLAKYFPLFIVLLIGAFLRFVKIGQFFIFDYDQQVPAEAAYDFFVNHKLTLIGQELSFEGFFLGPIHNWIQFIPYGVCRLLPDCVPYFFGIIGLTTAIIFYALIKKIIDAKTALIASAIYLISIASIANEWNVNSNYFLFLSSIGLLFCLYRFFSGKNIYLVLGAGIGGLSTVNFNPVYLFSVLAFFIASLTQKKRNYLIYSLAAGAFLINYLPLFIFNFRHNNLLAISIKNFLNQSVANSDYLEKITYLIKDVLIPYYSNFLFQNTNLFFILLTLFLIILGIREAMNSHNKILQFLPIWILITFTGFIFYRGHIPDYYFLQTILPFIILTTIAIRKNIFILILVSSLFFYLNISRVIFAQSSSSYQFKKSIINYVINDSDGKTFNVYYQMPQGINTGYDYLFKVLGKNPQEGGENLYILELIDPNRFDITKYLKAFRDKQVTVKVIGFMNIISVK